MLKKKQNIVFITGNQNKLREVREILGDNFNVVNVNADLQEIQSTDVKEVINEKIKEANIIFRKKDILDKIIDEFNKLNVNIKNFNDFTVICEDTGLHIDSMNIGEKAELEPTKMFPGALIKFYLQSLGADGIIKMNKNSNARLSCYIGIIKNGKIIDPVEGIVEGKIAKKYKDGGFGFDPCFIPKIDLGNIYKNKTYGELPSEIKNKISHRAVAFENLKKILSSEIPIANKNNFKDKHLKYKEKYLNLKKNIQV